MAPGAADVPEICDIVINGERYMFATDEQNKAAFSYAQPFVPRINTEAETDEKEDWWLSWSQTDWSGGERQRYQARTPEDANRFWRGKNIDIRKDGDVTITTEKSDITFASNPKTSVGGPNKLVWFATTTNLYSINESGTISDKGAHGLGAAPSRFGSCIAGGGTDIFVSTTTAGTVGVRRYNGAAFATYSATGADSLAFLNNALYGYSKSTGQFMRYTPGTAPVAAVEIYTWKNPEAVALTGVETVLRPLGGKMAILRHRGAGQRSAAELWIYDGIAAPSLVAEFPMNFAAYEMETKSGTVFVTGSYEISGNQIPAILFFKDGVIGELWRGEQGISSSTAYPAIASWEAGVLFSDPSGYPGTSLERIVYYNEEKGSISTILEIDNIVGLSPIISSSSQFVLIIPSSSSGTTGYQWGTSTVLNASGEVDTPYIDFNSSLRKLPRGVVVEFEDDPSDSSSSVDIKYSFDGTNSYTTLQTDAVSGTEYRITAPSEGTTYDSVSIRVVLNRGSVGAVFGPKLKRIKSRSIPVGRNALSKRTYRLQLIGKDGEGHVLFYNGETHWKDGKQMHADLRTAAAKTAYFTVTDTMGGYSAVIDQMNVIQIRKDEFIAEITFREV